MTRQSYENYGSRRDDSSMWSNPLPLALIGLGVGWLVWSNTSHPQVDARLYEARRRARQYGNRALHQAEEWRDQAANRAAEWRDQATNRASELRDDVSDRAQSLRSRVSGSDARGSQAPGGYGNYQGDIYGGGGSQTDYRERARHYGDEASRRAQQGYNSFVGLVDEHPLMAGIVGVAVGAVLGASIPSSRYENELLGDYSDEFYDRAREYGSETIDRATAVVRTAAEAGVEAAREAGQEEAQKQGLTAEQVEQGAKEKAENRQS